MGRLRANRKKYERQASPRDSCLSGGDLNDPLADFLILYFVCSPLQSCRVSLNGGKIEHKKTGAEAGFSRE